PIWFRYRRPTLHDFNDVLCPSLSVDGYVPFATPHCQIRHINAYFDEGDSGRLHLFPSLVRYRQPLFVRPLKALRIGGEFAQLLPLSGRVPSNSRSRFAACCPFCDFSPILFLMEHDLSYGGYLISTLRSPRVR